MADPRITRLEPLPPRGLRVRVHLDRGDPLEVALEALERLSLGLGAALARNLRHHLLDADAEVQVRDAALNLLSHRARTRTELRKRLVAKGFRPARVDPCLDRLQQRGLLDDAAVASAFVRDRLRHRPRGKARLTQELRAKGVEGGLAQRVVDAVLDDEEVTEAELARRVVEGWINRQGPRILTALASDGRSGESEKARRRLYGYLARRGFRGQALGRAMDLARDLARAPGTG